MSRDVELAAKRVILALVGLVALVPFFVIATEVVEEPDGGGFAMLLLFLVGATLLPFVLTRWERWPQLKSGNRVGALFLSSYLPAPIFLVLVGYEHAEGSALIGGPLAVAVTSLWWAFRGYELDGD